MDATLDTLLRTPATVTVGGKTYTLKPFGVRAVPVMSRLVGDVWGELVQRPDLLAKDNKDALVGWLLLRLPTLIETKIDDLLTLLAMQTGETVDALAALPLDDFIELGRAGLGDAHDFFTRRILPMIPQMKAAMAEHGIGATSSPPSSPPDTAATT